MNKNNLHKKLCQECGEPLELITEHSMFLCPSESCGWCISEVDYDYETLLNDYDILNYHENTTDENLYYLNNLK